MPVRNSSRSPLLRTRLAFVTHLTALTASLLSKTVGLLHPPGWLQDAGTAQTRRTERERRANGERTAKRGKRRRRPTEVAEACFDYIGTPVGSYYKV